MENRSIAAGSALSFTLRLMGGAGIMLVALFGGCMTQTIPYNMGHIADYPDDARIAGNITLHIDEPLRHMTTTIKPVNMPMTIGYRFLVGESITTNLVLGLRTMFTDVALASTNIGALRDRSLVLDVKLLDHSIHIDPNVRGVHSVRLKMRYSFYTFNGEPLFALDADSRGESGLRSKMAATLVTKDGRRMPVWKGPVDVGKLHRDYRGSIGWAFDEALGKSIEELAARVMREEKQLSEIQ